MQQGMGINGVPNENKKSCFDCKHCQAATSWWCVNEIASNERGTRIPGVIGCPHWEPIPTKEQLRVNSSMLGRLFGSYTDGYIEVDLSKNNSN